MTMAELDLCDDEDDALRLQEEEDEGDDGEESLAESIDAVLPEDDDETRIRQLGFLEDVRMALCDESNKASGAKESRIFANTAGNVAGTSLIMSDEFVDKLPALLSNLPLMHKHLNQVDPIHFPCWIEVHNGPVATGFLFATWAPTQKSDTLVMMRMFRGNSKGAVPYVVSW
jgi:hypothetical protein